MIQNLEENLKRWYLTKDENVFLDTCYEYLGIVAAHICGKYNIPNKDIKDTINDLVSEAWIKLPEKYNPEINWSAKTWVFKIMSQFLNNKIRHDTANKRDKKMLIYIEEMTDELLHTSTLIEIEVDLFQFYKTTILEHREIFAKLDKRHKKISDKILDAIENPETYKCVRGSFTGDIAKKCKVSLDDVHNVMKTMNKLVEQNEL